MSSWSGHVPDCGVAELDLPLRGCEDLGDLLGSEQPVGIAVSSPDPGGEVVGVVADDQQDAAGTDRSGEP